jgi:hypothetical protein
MHPNPKKSKLLAALQVIRQDFEAAVIREIEAHPEWPFWRVGEQVGISEATVQKISKSKNISRPAGPRPKAETSEKGDN